MYDKAFTTKHELRYIDRLGKWGGRDRAECLKGYIESADKRENWGKVDSEEAIKHAQECLNAIVGEAKAPRLKDNAKRIPPQTRGKTQKQK